MLDKSGSGMGEGPQRLAVALPRRRHRRLKFLVLLAVVGGGGLYLAREKFGSRDDLIHALQDPAALAKQLASAKDATTKSPAAPASGPARPPAPVAVAQSVEKPMPVEFRSVGSVQAESSVTLKPRVDSVVEKVLVEDGALVKKGEVVVELDSRPVRAQIEQIKATIAKDAAQVEQANRNDTRSAGLAARGFTSRVTADDAKTNVGVMLATQAADEASLKSLELQLTFHTIRAPIDGKIGIVAVRPGAWVRAADTTTSSVIATINQIDPIYISIAVPQWLLPELNQAQQQKTAQMEVIVPGSTQRISGPVSVIDNSVDASTGLVTVRARVANKQLMLWPGQVADIRLILREEPKAIVVPNEAIQTSQEGNFVFVVDDKSVAHVRKITIARTVGLESVVGRGLSAGEQIVTDGQLRLFEGAKVTVGGAGAPKREAEASRKGDVVR